MFRSDAPSNIKQKLDFKPFERAGVISIFLLLFTFGLWSVTAKVNGAIISQGQVEVLSGRHIVQHKYGGNVKEIFVSENDVVSKGQLLIRLDDSEITSQLNSTELRYYEMVAQTDRLRAEASLSSEIEFEQALLEAALDRPNLAAIVETQQSLFETRRQSTANQVALLEERISQYDQQILSSKEQIESLEVQKKTHDEEVTRTRTLLNQKLATTATMTAALNTQSQIQMNLVSERSNLTRYQSEKDQTLSELSGFETERLASVYQELRTAEAQRNTLAEETRQLRDQFSRLDIVSPDDGYVYEFSVTSLEAVIQPAEPIMYIVPNASEYILKTTVGPADIDEVYLGQMAEVQFSGLSAHLLPKLSGNVVAISADAIADERNGSSYFEVETSIPEAELEKLGDIQLHPGMSAEVFFVTQTQTPLSYLTAPARRYFDRALR